jgi:hypothetical protein
MSRYSANDRYRGGSFEGRLNPEINYRDLNVKASPFRKGGLPVRSTSGAAGCVYEERPGIRRRTIGLPSKFDNAG